MTDVAPTEPMAIATHRNYKYAAPLALKPLKTRVMNYAQASIKLASINCSIKLADVYDRITVPLPKPVLVKVSDKEVREALAAQKPKRAKKR